MDWGLGTRVSAVGFRDSHSRLDEIGLRLM